MGDAEVHTVTSDDGLRLHVHLWDVLSPGGTVLLVHGLGEHGGRYRETAERLNESGLRVLAADHRGHGLSEGPRTYTPTFGHLLDDLERVEREFCDRGQPLAIWGHSLGGLIALRYLQTRQTGARAAVISAPWLGQSPSATLVKRWAARVVGTIWPSAPFPTGIRGEMLTRDERKQREYDDDPLVRKTLSPRLFREGAGAIARAFADAGKVMVDVLFLVPETDSLVNPAETLRFTRTLDPDRCTVVRRGDWRHEPHNELDRVQLLQQVGQWLDERLTK